MLENGFNGQRRHFLEVIAMLTVLKRYGKFAFRFWRFLSDRHKISIQSKKPLGVIYLATCMPIFRLMGIFKQKLSLVKKAEKWKL